VLSLPPSVRLFVPTQPVDGRKQADSLMAIVRDVFGHDPLSGHLFVVFSKRLDRVRVVCWDRTGFAMWAKRLERGRFRPALASDGTFAVAALEAAELALVIEGIDLARGREPTSAVAAAERRDHLSRIVHRGDFLVVDGRRSSGRCRTRTRRSLRR
jgi:transposase